ncbi:hypothetical protein [Mesorhizobium sp. INR15]|uniref:hypothetical protein n=1 Tax=Mesorhizobium sp. INR15 TaxID=2654248 RepID=UPI0018966D0D|nr:hypothetical protein [Mesorhizobium sp. INR15]QPC90999.1 hypothetical protein GA829_10590 [Mesorhizobium sp. INR15]
MATDVFMFASSGKVCVGRRLHSWAISVASLQPISSGHFRDHEIQRNLVSDAPFGRIGLAVVQLFRRLKLQVGVSVHSVKNADHVLYGSLHLALAFTCSKKTGAGTMNLSLLRDSPKAKSGKWTGGNSDFLDAESGVFHINIDSITLSGGGTLFSYNDDGADQQEGFGLRAGGDKATRFEWQIG